MLKIGDFSKICQVSVKSLRHWDSEGLLTPALTDPHSGYRYYTIEQIEQVNRILALKTLGLSLTQIAQFLADQVTASDIRAMLRLKQAELQQQIETAAAMLTLVEARLSDIETSGQPPQYEIALKSADEQAMLAIRETMPSMDALVEVLYETHSYAREKSSTNLLAVFHDDGYHVETVDVEVGFPIERATQRVIPLRAGREMTVRTLPAVPLLACTVHHGSWLALSQGYTALGKWIVANGYRIAGAGREIFHAIDWASQHKANVTELQFPIVKYSA